MQPTHLDSHHERSSTSVSLRSVDGTIHHIDADLLGRQSGLFETMLSLPEPDSQNHSRPIIDVFENTATLSATLHLLNGGSICWASIEEAYPILELVDKWDCPEVMDQIRCHMSAGAIPQKQALRFYALAKYLGWTKEARQVSKFTLSVDLSTAAEAEIFSQIPVKDAQLLMDLRRRRWVMFTRLLDSPTRFTGGNSSLYYCDSCCNSHPQDRLWHSFKCALSAEMDRMPCGSKILDLAGGQGLAWPEAQACWESRCLTPGCGAVRFDQRATLLQIRKCVEVLPCFID